jgi:glycine/D-amino acid oxidase-like deaminating enzyme/nitrite reductase/ring-hydroxylating ferredoxin subunit
MSTARKRKKTAEEGTGTTSLWVADQKPEKRPALRRNARADVCVIGGGIAGLTTAYLLGCEGRKVILIDAAPLALGETSRTTAHLSSAIDDRFWWIEQVHGHEGSQLAAESHSSAIDRIEAIVRKEGIDCNFDRLDGYLFNPLEKETEDLERELAAARRAGLDDVELLDELPGRPLPSGRCLRFPRQGQFHPLRYLSSLAHAIERDGGRIHTETSAKSIEGGSPARVVIGKGATVTADAVVVATNVPIHTRVAVHAKQAPYRTYALAFEIPANSVPAALYWDTLSPYHYLRTARDGDQDLLILGGEDHKTGQEEDPAGRVARLEDWGRAHFPMAGPIRYGWSGQVVETVDGVAFIGKSPGEEYENVLLATGDSGMGMTHGTIAGILLTDLIQGRENPWAKLYDPSRRSLRAVPELAKENLNAAAQYADFVTPGEVSEASQITPGSGAILRRGVHKLAVYRDEKGKVTERSAVCPHLGCVVSWNDLEKSWDCPCHGSRFDPTGRRVLNGPAGVGLSPVEE